ncbi:HNH endonuclease [Mariniflexile soesokkakense]|uniref:HNH endonuclease n=1 Tax=Mariniflexile soesokkakense TaxID=1343160 RepID=A0ABV0AG32_9FLAO
MANRWGIPKDVKDFVKNRDKNCVFCSIEFTNNNESRKSKPSCEHIINDIRINGIENISLCCMSCNSSKGAKLLDNWLLSDYCKKNKITKDTVAIVVKEAIKNPPKRKQLCTSVNG